MKNTEEIINEIESKIGQYKEELSMFPLTLMPPERLENIAITEELELLLKFIKDPNPSVMLELYPLDEK